MPPNKNDENKTKKQKLFFYFQTQIVGLVSLLIINPPVLNH